MSFDEKEPEATAIIINHPQSTPTKNNHANISPTIEDADSVNSITPNLTPAATRRDDDRESSPFSPFYTHPTTRYSLEAQKSESKLNVNVYESDVEACLTDSQTNVLQSSTRTRNKECTVWPGQRAMMEKKKAAKRQRGCNPLRKFDKRTKIWIKVCIAILFVGIAVGVGVGVSKAVGGGVWGPNSGTKPISR
jgi:hypothetical protein